MLMGVTAVSPVQEVHQWASEQEQVRKHTENVRPVLGNQEETADREKTDQYPSSRRTASAVVVFVLRHDNLPHANNRRICR